MRTRSQTCPPVGWSVPSDEPVSALLLFSQFTIICSSGSSGRLASNQSLNFNCAIPRTDSTHCKKHPGSINKQESKAKQSAFMPSSESCKASSSYW